MDIEEIKLIKDSIIALVNAWPLFLLIIIFIFRQNLSELLSRMRKGPLNMEFDDLQKHQILAPLPAHLAIPPNLASPSMPALTAEDIKKSIRELGISAIPDYYLVKFQEEKISEDIATIENDKKKIALLIKFLSHARMATHFEQIYGAIFTSQIEFLKKLNTEKTIGQEKAKEFFEKYKKERMDFYRTFDFKEWMDFLITRRLVVFEDNQYTLSDIGRDFVYYLKINIPYIKEIG